MTVEFFKAQMGRLRIRFSDRAFDDEFIKLAWREIGEMSDLAFKRNVDIWIGHRPYHQPPLLAEFREARLAELREVLRTDAKLIKNVLEAEAKRRSISEVLKPLFGANDMREALRAARRRLLAEERGPDDCI
jgi:hypothetical protein